MPLELFQAPLSPPCRAVIVLTKLLHLDVNLVSIDMADRAHLKPDFLKINPFHTIPALKDGEFRLFESRAILVYLANRYSADSSLYPADIQQRALVDAMLNFDVGTLAAGITRRLKCILMTGRDVSDKELDSGQDHLKCLDNVLKTSSFAAADHMTLADIAIVHTLSILEALEEDLSDYVHLRAYIDRVKSELGDIYKEVNEEVTEELKRALKSKRTV